MKKHFRGDNGQLRAPKKMPNGFLRADAFLTRVGVFEYRNADGTTRRELRLPEEVFDVDSMQSFEMAPVTLGHPPRPVTARNAKRYSIGHAGQDVRKDGGKMRASIMITDDDAIAAMKRGTREVSNGYFCDLEETSGVTAGIDGVDDGLIFDCIQRNIVGNHIAIVDRGRAGSSVRARVDGFTVDADIDVAFCFHQDEQDDDEQEWRALIADETPDIVSAWQAWSQKKCTAVVDAINAATTCKQGNGNADASTDASDDSFAVVVVRQAVSHSQTPKSVADALSLTDNALESLLSEADTPTAEQLEGFAKLFSVDVANLRALLCDDKKDRQTEKKQMEEFELTIDGLPFKFQGDSTARAAVTKKLADSVDALVKADARADDAEAKASEAAARADAAEEAKAKAEAERDAAVDPSAMRARIDARLDLERQAADILGEEFDKTKADGELLSACILKVQPSAKLDGKDDAYIAARFDAVVEIYDAAKQQEEKTDVEDKSVPTHAPIRRALDKQEVSDGMDRVAKARDDARKRNAAMWKQPMALSKDK